MNDKISVIVPIYKVEEYLNRCVESLVNQSYQNLEIILIDDGSPDKCPAMCDEWAIKDRRIKVVHKQNGGVSSARNEGLKYVTGEYIAWADPDDWLELDAYEKTIEVAERYKADIVITRFVENENIIHTTDEIIKIENAHKTYRNAQITPMLWDKLYRRNLFNDVFFYGNIDEDNSCNDIIFKKVKRAYSFDKLTYHYWNRENSMTSATSERWMNILKRDIEAKEKMKWSTIKEEKEINYGILLDAITMFAKAQSKHEKDFAKYVLRKVMYKQHFLFSPMWKKKYMLKGILIVIGLVK